jgi:hypothetical protein
MEMPSGWSVAPDNTDSQTVIHLYPWSSMTCVVADGNAYGTALYSEGLYSEDSLRQYDDTYMPAGCSQILIYHTGASFSPSASPTVVVDTASKIESFQAVMRTMTVDARAFADEFFN